jgi:hypothetical protein
MNDPRDPFAVRYRTLMALIVMKVADRFPYSLLFYYICGPYAKGLNHF